MAFVSSVQVGVLASLLARADPAVAGAARALDPDKFAPNTTDPWRDVQPPSGGRLQYIGFFVPLTVSNQVVRVLERAPLVAYGLDVQLGLELFYRREDGLALSVRPEAGYALLHHRDFTGHAGIAGVALCSVWDPPIDLCVTPSFVAGAEAGAAALGVRTAFGLSLLRFRAVSLEFQHGATWVGAADVRHELRGALTLNLMSLIVSIHDFVGFAKGMR